jgi:thiamine biosynthesis protein ThiS
MGFSQTTKNEEPLFMTLTINGEARQFENLSTLADLIEALGLKGDRVAVELNHNIVPRPNWPATSLKDGDKLEIVHFVGGGLR